MLASNFETSDEAIHHANAIYKYFLINGFFQRADFIENLFRLSGDDEGSEMLYDISIAFEVDIEKLSEILGFSEDMIFECLGCLFIQEEIEIDIKKCLFESTLIIRVNAIDVVAPR